MIKNLRHAPVPTWCPAPFQAVPVATVAPGFAAPGFAGASPDVPAPLMLQLSPPEVALSPPLSPPAPLPDARSPLQTRKQQHR